MRRPRTDSGETMRSDGARKPARTRLEFVAIGLDHTTAGIDVRERVAFTDAEIPAALQRLTDPATRLLGQAAILSTCNRVELYGVSRSRPSRRRLASFLARYHGLDPIRLASTLYVYSDDRVAHHLAATAAGMHSLVLGEAQILGQVRKARDHAVAAGTAGVELRRMFEWAIATGRRVRSQTAIGRGAASVSYASVELARRRLGTLGESTALLIGSGDTIALAAEQLVKRGAEQLLVLGRAAARAERLAASSGGRAITADRLGEALVRSDLVISATGAPQPVLSRDHLSHALACRCADAAPLLVIDLSVPRDVDPAAAKLPGVELYTIDDLRGDVERTLMQRRAELPEAYRVLEGERARFTRWLRRREMASLAPTPPLAALCPSGRPASWAPGHLA